MPLSFVKLLYHRSGVGGRKGSCGIRFDILVCKTTKNEIRVQQRGGRYEKWAEGKGNHPAPFSAMFRAGGVEANYENL